MNVMIFTGNVDTDPEGKRIATHFLSDSQMFFSGFHTEAMWIVDKQMGLVVAVDFDHGLTNEGETIFFVTYALPGREDSELVSISTDDPNFQLRKHGSFDEDHLVEVIMKERANVPVCS